MVDANVTGSANGYQITFRMIIFRPVNMVNDQGIFLGRFSLAAYAAVVIASAYGFFKQWDKAWGMDHICPSPSPVRILVPCKLCGDFLAHFVGVLMAVIVKAVTTARTAFAIGWTRERTPAFPARQFRSACAPRLECRVEASIARPSEYHLAWSVFRTLYLPGSLAVVGTMRAVSAPKLLMAVGTLFDFALKCVPASFRANALSYKAWESFERSVAYDAGERHFPALPSWIEPPWSGLWHTPILGRHFEWSNSTEVVL